MTQRSLNLDGAPLEIRRSAVFSPCCTWRYTLSRVWDDSKPMLLFVLLNPSTDTDKQDDPTNRRGIDFAQRWGFGAVVFVNLFAIRSPYPKRIKEVDDPVGPWNDSNILDQARDAGKIICAWGTHGVYQGRDHEVLRMLSGYELYALRITKGGHPEHPLYMPKSVEPVNYCATKIGD